MHRTPLVEEDSEPSPHYIHYSYPHLPTYNNHQPQQIHPIPQQHLSLIHSIDLYRAKEKFKTFIEEIGRLKYTPLRADITAYCGMQKKT